MGAYPWYLLAAGIGLIVLGILLAALTGSGSRGGWVDPRMSDEEIARRMQGSEGGLLPRLMVFLGLLCVFVSVVWRIARIFF